MKSLSATQRVRTNGAVSAFAGVSADGYQARRRLRRRRVAYGKAVGAWRPDAGVKFLRDKFLMDDGGKKARSPGTARYQPEVHCGRGCRVSPVRPYLLVCFLLSTFAHEAAGARCARHSRRPSFWGG